MDDSSEQRQEQPARWERVYLQVINMLFAVAGALFSWNVFSTSDWRVRSGFIFIVVWIIALRGGERLVPTELITRVQDWRAVRRFNEFLFNLLWVGFPLSVFGYFVRWHSRWELITLIVLMSLVPLFMWRSNRTVRPDIHQ